jgi:hypothetical protein
MSVWCMCVFISVCVKQLLYGMMFYFHYFSKVILTTFIVIAFLLFVGNLFF